MWSSVSMAGWFVSRSRFACSVVLRHLARRAKVCTVRIGQLLQGLHRKQNSRLVLVQAESRAVVAPRIGTSAAICLKPKTRTDRNTVKVTRRRRGGPLCRDFPAVSRYVWSVSTIT